MTRSDAEWADWAREHRVAFEVQPLLEMRRGEKVQAGFTVTLYAAAPMEEAPGADRQEAIRRLREELRALAQAAAPPERGAARAELDPPHAAVLRPENEFEPEVALTWRVFYPDDLTPVTVEDRQALSRVEKRLLALGLKQGRW